MEKKYRYEWVGNPYNDEDFKNGQKFYVLDTITGIKYEYPLIERKQNRNGGYFNQRLVDSNLWNQEFMEFSCATSPDDSKYTPQEFITPELCMIALKNTSDHYFIRKIDEKDLTREMCVISTSRFPESFPYVPANMLSMQMIKNGIVVDGDLIASVPLSLLNADIFELAIDHNAKMSTISYLFDREERKEKLFRIMTPEIAAKLFNLSFEYISRIPERLITKEMSEVATKRKPYYIRYVPAKFITKEMAERAVAERGFTLKYVPQNLITAELCNTAVQNDPSAIQYVPSQFQSTTLHKLALDKNGRAIADIPQEFITNELIVYAIRSNPLALGSLPDEVRTPELCELAVSLKGGALTNVPEKYRTYEMCKTAVLSDPKTIRKVPVEILTPEFYNEVIQNGAIIPIKHMGYVRECLEINKKLAEENPLKTNKGAVVENPVPDYSNYADKPLQSISWFFSPTALKHLEKFGVINLGQLFTLVDCPDFATLFSSSVAFREIKGTTKLLKCKFLNEDPLIDESDEELTVDELSSMFGFTNRTTNAFRRTGTTAKRFFEIMRSETPQLELENIRYLGDSGVREIMEKAKIVMDYHDQHKNQDESLEQLNAELQRLIEERRKIDEQTDLVLAKIQEKLKTQSKGGVLK